MLLAIVTTIAAGGAFLVAELGSPSTEALLRPDDGEVVALGQRVYDARCASCHGEELEGEPDWQAPDEGGFLPAPPHDETGHTWHHSDEVLFDITKNGLKAYAGPDYRTRMPEFGDVLTDEEIIAALSYIKSRWPQEIKDRHDAMNAARRESIR